MTTQADTLVEDKIVAVLRRLGIESGPTSPPAA